MPGTLALDRVLREELPFGFEFLASKGGQQQPDALPDGDAPNADEYLLLMAFCDLSEAWRSKPVMQAVRLDETSMNALNDSLQTCEGDDWRSEYFVVN